MLKCIKKLMQIESIADRRIAAIERKITNVAAFPYGDTRKQIASVLRATERKRAVERLVLTARRLRLALRPDELLLIELLSQDAPLRVIAERLHTNKQSVFRRRKRVIKTTENVLFLLGYDAQALKRDCDLAYWYT